MNLENTHTHTQTHKAETKKERRKQNMLLINRNETRKEQK